MSGNISIGLSVRLILKCSLKLFWGNLFCLPIEIFPKIFQRTFQSTCGRIKLYFLLKYIKENLMNGSVWWIYKNSVKNLGNILIFAYRLKYFPQYFRENFNLFTGGTNLKIFPKIIKGTFSNSSDDFSFGKENVLFG